MRRSPRATRLGFEVLEDRCLLTADIFDLGAGFEANAINNAGLVAGSASGHAALWQNSATVDLGTLGGASSRANDVNEAGQVVGYADTAAGLRHAFLLTPEDTDGNGQTDRWFRDDDLNGSNDLMLDLGTLGGSTSDARGINNLGQVVGRADMSTAAGSYRAFLWDSVAGMQNLGTFGRDASEANAINDAAEVAGTVYSFKLGNPSFLSGINGFRWGPAGGGSLLVSGIGGAAKTTAINQAGQIVGNEGQLASSGSFFSSFYRTTDAALWQNGTRTDLGFTPPYIDLYGGAEFDVSINKHAQIVGLGYLWQEGARIDLNSLVDPSLGWTVSTASDINDAGMIVGQGTHAGVSASFLLNYDAPPPPPRITIGDRSVTEGNTGAANVVFTVNLSRPVDQTVMVDFGTGNGSATAGSDYQAVLGTLTILAGETIGMISVPVNGDRVAEANETFFVILASATNATIADGHGMGTIADDEPRISISDVNMSEGAKGSKTFFTFTVTLSAAYDQPVTMSFQTVNGTAITGDSDYIAKTGTLTFAPGETTKTITIEVKGDSKREAHESFFVDLYNNSLNSLFTKNRGLGTILNDD